jgi:transposase-like protein
MAKVKNKFSSKDKVKMIFEGLAYPDGIQAYCRKVGIRDGLYYKWKNQLVDNAANIFEKVSKPNKSEEHLKAVINKKDKIISELVEENIDLKKNDGTFL